MILSAIWPLQRCSFRVSNPVRAHQSAATIEKPRRPDGTTTLCGKSSVRVRPYPYLLRERQARRLRRLARLAFALAGGSQGFVLLILTPLAASRSSYFLSSTASISFVG